MKKAASFAAEVSAICCAFLLTFLSGAGYPAQITHTLTSKITTISPGGTAGPITSTITNTGSSSYTVNLWASVYTPGGSWVNSVSTQFTLAGGQTLSNNNINMYVPPLAGTGTYYFCEYVNDSGGNAIDHECVSFTVSSGGSSNKTSCDFGSASVSGTGNFTYSGTESSSSGANQSASDSGTSSVNSDGSIAFSSSGGGLLQCGLRSDATAAVCAKVSDAANQQFRM
ncbi:MAG: hypothetical protein HQL08_14915, partial [Nitrospirae bacterium]|nr:hypothetical protein [Nitrospirota bacterium]